MRRVSVRVFVAIAALAATLALPAGASALDGGHGAWEPGKMLVRFRGGVAAGERARLADRAGATLDHALPLVPNLWELRTTGNVEATVARLASEAGVEYAQPNYLDDETEDAGPADQAYWPNDPYFWPTRFPNQNGCGDTALASWQFWPLGQNLTSSAAPAAAFNPNPADQRILVPGGAPLFSAYSSINVLPVWNLVRGQDRLGGPALGGWSTEDIETAGVGVIDTGIAPHPDLRQQVAALYSVVTSREEERGVTSTRTRVREVYANGRRRDDITAVRDALEKQSADGETEVQQVDRAPFILDDATGFGVDSGAKGDRRLTQKGPGIPLGCDGHGTAVSSLVTARGNDSIGTVGAGFNVPVVGIRQGMPWDEPHVSFATDSEFGDAYRAWQRWQEHADFTDEDRIDEYAIADALRLPVINMSYGGGMLRAGHDAQDRSRTVVARPATLEAIGRVLSTGRTLGVAAAGNGRELYGRGTKAIGARLLSGGKKKAGIEQPCGISMIGQLKPWEQAPDPDHPRQMIAVRPYDPGIAWSHLQLICVASTTSVGSALAPSSGSGDAGVALAAPGQNVTTAERPAVDAPGGGNAYENGSGTSYAAPVVAGAAALLRRAAPGAPIDVIRRALEGGARMSFNLIGKVRWGSLDVACALRWLDRRRQPGWHLIPISQLRSPKAYADFIDATTSCGGNRPALVTESTLKVEKTDLTDAKSAGSVGALLGRYNIDHAQLNSVARRWQSLLLAETDVQNAPGTATAFGVGRAAFTNPLTTAGMARPRTVYDAGTVDAGCPENYAITALDVALRNVVHPPVWVFPTDAVAPPQEIQLAVGIAKPWYFGLVGDPITVRVKAICQYFPQVTR